MDFFKALGSFLKFYLEDQGMVNGLPFGKYHVGLCIVSLLTLMSPEVLGEMICEYIGKNGGRLYTNMAPPLDGAYKLVKPCKKTSSQVRTGEDNTVKSGKLRSNSDNRPPIITQLPYQEHIHEVAKQYNINPELVKAVIKVESNYNPKAVSPKGAQGLMQLMPETARRFGVKDAFDPEENIVGGVKYLRFLLDLFQGNLELALAGYNAGEQRVIQHGHTIPPIAETQGYVEKVLRLYGLSPTLAKLSEPIYRFIDKNGVLTFTNIPRIKN